MPKDSLNEALTELRSRLDQEERVQPEDREALNELAARVELMINESKEHWDEGVLDELEKQEAHPVIARVISQILTTLNGMGL